MDYYSRQERLHRLIGKGIKLVVGMAVAYALATRYLGWEITSLVVMLVMTLVDNQ